jgi:hypothetical protein
MSAFSASVTSSVRVVFSAPDAGSPMNIFIPIAGVAVGGNALGAGFYWLRVGRGSKALVVDGSAVA